MKTFINDEILRKKGFSVSTDKSLLDKKAIYDFLKNDSYWSKSLTEEKLNRAIDHSLCFGVYDKNKIVGFCRVVTDHANFAYLCDVFILPSYRKLGLSKWMLQTVLNHPDLQGLRRWMLATADAHGLYRQFGFTELSKPDTWMEIYKP